MTERQQERDERIGRVIGTYEVEASRRLLADDQNRRVRADRAIEVHARYIARLHDRMSELKAENAKLRRRIDDIDRPESECEVENG